MPKIKDTLAQPYFAYGIWLWAILIVALVPDTWVSYLRYEVSQGQLWRLFSAGIAHTNGYHLLFNGAALVVLAFLHGHYFRPNQLHLLLIYLVLAVSIGLYAFYPDTSHYVGLSGALHGLVLIGAFIDSQKKMITGYLLFAGVIIKVIYEQFWGSTTSVESLIDARVATESHLLGVVAALVVLPLFRLAKTTRATNV
ncbi:rhombosortase [Paraferrimonas sp. SM1919]|uniref:rhombosortase n=1 Tax=Paraferrimonas sp. SM1919 TaxID=2662263 RepID=UPI0013D5B53E|nr:rhombosortase [Paraferrimonas sp. SM1919]